MNESHRTDEKNGSHDIEEMEKEYGEEAPSAEFSALLEQTPLPEKQKEVSVGQRITGKIQDIRGAVALVEYGGRSEAVIDTQELRNELGEIAHSPGDTIEAYVASTEGEVRLTLSLRASSREILMHAFRSGVPIEGRVTGFNTGGLVVNLGGMRAFCPLSQIDTGYSEDLASYAGQTLTFKIIEFRNRGRNIVLSRRAYMEDEAKRRARELRSKLSKGAEMTGRVTRVERFGAFVDIGGIEGLIHVSELGHARVANPRDVVSSGDEVRVKILELKDLGGDKERISLSMKALLPDPWDQAMERFKDGDTITGKVVSIQNFGAFVEVIPGVEGLVHVSQLANRRVSRPGEVVSVGQEVHARIQGIDREQKRISLSMKAVQEEAAQTAEDREISEFKTKQEQAQDDSGSMADALRRAGLIQ